MKNIYYIKNKVNIPNLITLSRLIFLFLLFQNRNHKYLGFVWLAVFWGLDMIDGTIARYLSQTSTFGAGLDIGVDFTGVIVLVTMLLMRFKNNPIRMYIAKIHIFIMLFCLIINVTNVHKARHTVSRFKLVNMYLHNNIRNRFASILSFNSCLIPYILYKYYNRTLDYIYLIGEFIIITIYICRTL